ncbi:MAG TPA: ABC transporter permease, partial [Longimicrobiales bacterium]|nr:ABC transporter permease [Longimicrobiales bacterium]
MTWRIELSRPAVAALRALPRAEQRRVAERIRHLEASGPPPGAPAAGAIPVPAGDQVLLCVGDPEERRLVVVTLLPARSPSPVGAMGRLALTWMTRMTGGGGMGGFAQDIRHAARTLFKAPTFTVAAVLTLALGIGATTAVFSVVDGVLLEPLPYGDADRVITVWTNSEGSSKGWLSEDEFLYFYQQNRTLDDLALYYTTAHNLTSVDDPERVVSGVVTPNLFGVLGVEPALGRSFTWDEARQEVP